MSVRPAPSSTENVVIGDSRARARATISCGGSISSSSSSREERGKRKVFPPITFGGFCRRAAGTLTGRDRATCGAGAGAGRGTAGIMRGGAAGDGDVDEEDRGGERRRSGRASRMPSGGLRRRGRGLGFAGRTEDRMSGRLNGCGGSGEPDPAEKRSSSWSSKAVVADWSPAAARAPWLS